MGGLGSGHGKGIRAVAQIKLGEKLLIKPTVKEIDRYSAFFVIIITKFELICKFLLQQVSYFDKSGTLTPLESDFQSRFREKRRLD